MMVGDGINDVLSFIRVDIGMVIGVGIDVVIELGDVIFVKSNFFDIINFLFFLKNMMKKMV